MKVGDIYEDKDGSRFVIDRTEVVFHAEGGGFTIKMDATTFKSKFKPAKDKTWSAYWFNINDGTYYHGLWDGTCWNGWAVPWFHREIAIEIVKDVCQPGSGYTGGVEGGAPDLWLEDGEGDSALLTKVINGETMYGFDGWTWEVE